MLVTLSAADPAAKGSVTIPDSCRAFDMFGNPISGKTAPVSMTPLYLRVPKSNWKKILNSLEFRDLGDPFALRLSMGGKNLLNVSLTNRTNRGEKVELTDDARADMDRIQKIYEGMHLTGKFPKNYITH